MEKAYLEFLVLGKVPGTHLVLSFWQLFIPIALLSMIGLILLLGRMVVRTLHKIDPFYGAPKELTTNDLLAL